METKRILVAEDRICSKCGDPKLLTEEYFYITGSGVLSKECIECRRKRNNKFRIANKDRYKAEGIAKRAAEKLQAEKTADKQKAADNEWLNKQLDEADRQLHYGPRRAKAFLGGRKNSAPLGVAVKIGRRIKKYEKMINQKRFEYEQAEGMVR